MTHRESLELLPWYATLDESRRHELDAHVGDCEECAQELSEIQSIGRAIAPLDDAPEASPFLLQRTLTRIDDYERDKMQQPAGLRRLVAWWTFSPFTARALIAAQAVLLMTLGIGAVYFQRQAEYFSTLSGPAATTSGARFTIAFQPGISEEAVREALRDVGGVIIDGPSALGLYTLRVPKESNAEQVLAQLTANSRVVRFVQRNPD